ncbi:LRV FeS4 cluster domain-containing protein [Novosphingobium sp. Rr 2-17]|uniref:4Fe4S-binding leucine-rich repeat protein n=1 Tax=Novosphingobium sp. Rr 2-17 TaxID=555793 RepID=UPI000269A24C|nr:4Fe4S-binding leucine-rich repeat protein [Novosphingobium sp. Rr 2-17]EIZ77328.1 LRV FeS4 cluster domain-containing protein [Novosphingobium sp. Rr 2-17]
MTIADDDDIERALDWRGKVIRCRECDHSALNREGLCAKGKSCIRDRRARRVDRFLRENLTLADSYLDHPYFEVRACAAQYASVFHLPPLLDDPEPEVRAVTTMRLPADRIRQMAFDEDTRVRVAAAARLQGLDLMPLISDAEYMVRITAVRKMPVEMLPLVRHDPDPEVRTWVARRIDPRALADMTFDSDAMVRCEVATRIPMDQLPLLLRDSDMRVRFTVAERIAEEELFALLDDDEPIIRELAHERIAKVPALATRLARHSGKPALSVVSNDVDPHEESKS